MALILRRGLRLHDTETRLATTVQLPHMRRHSVSGLSLWAYLVRFLLA